jgi:hypothetical protein
MAEVYGAAGEVQNGGGFAKEETRGTRIERMLQIKTDLICDNPSHLFYPCSMLTQLEHG